MRITAQWLNDPAAQQVCALLTDAGYQAWFVGGCVRNALLNAPVADIDIATDARPEVVMTLAEAGGIRAVATGFDHGTVTVVAQNVPFEITTFRRDVDTDGRRATIEFAATKEEDARRRDFTMNALYAAPDGVVEDPVGGLPDLWERRVRFIGDAERRIREDYLRILRFFRFHAWYGGVEGGLDAAGLAACAALADGLEGLSRERVGAEMLKLLAAPDPAPSVAAMDRSGILQRVLPGADSSMLAVLVHVESQGGLSPEAIRRLAMIDGQGAEERFRLSRADARRLEILSDWCGRLSNPGEMGYRIGAVSALDVLAIQAARLSAEIDTNSARMARNSAELTMPVTARDLMPGLTGKALGDRLKEIEARWIASGFTLGREALLG